LKSENYRTDYVINMGYLTYPKVGKKRWLSLPGAPELRLPGLDYNERSKGVIKLPPGTWQIVCTSKTFEARHALEVLEWFELAAKCGFRDYSQPDDLRYPFEDHRQSLNSLLTSKGCDLNKIYLILKKK
jgi:hypothetical protein